MDRTCRIELSFRTKKGEDRRISFRLPIFTIINLIIENNTLVKSQLPSDVKACGIAGILKLVEDFFEI